VSSEEPRTVGCDMGEGPARPLRARGAARATQREGGGEREQANESESESESESGTDSQAFRGLSVWGVTDFVGGAPRVTVCPAPRVNRLPLATPWARH
jgi:hypothetical protein